MRVLFVVGHGGIYAGGAHQALYALRGLKRQGVEVAAVWGADAEGDLSGFRRLEQLGIPYWIEPVNKRPSIRSIFRLRRIIREFRPDVIEAVKSSAQYHLLFGGVWGFDAKMIFYRGISRPMEWGQALKYRLKSVKRIIANCSALKTIMIESGHIIHDKIDVIPGEYDPSCSDPDRVDSRGLREELRIPTGVPIITQLGNYSEWRGQHVTIKAAQMLQRHGVPFHLLFAGQGNERLLPLIKEHGLERSVTISKYRRDPERILKESWVVINASTGNESLPGSMLNAQAMGAPSVASDMPGVVDIIEDGVTGFIVPVGDAERLAEAVGTILQLPTNDYQRMSRAARSRAQKLFGSEARANLRIATYEKALEG